MASILTWPLAVLTVTEPSAEPMVMLPLAVRHAHRHDVAQHRRGMISLFIGALVVAGLFTFLSGRIMHAVVFGP